MGVSKAALRRGVARASKGVQKHQVRRIALTGMIGGEVQADRAGYIWVRLNGDPNAVLRVKNRGVPPVPNLWVEVGEDPKEPGVTVVLGYAYRGAAGGETGRNYVAPHAPQHGEGGGDDLYVSGNRFLPLLLAPQATRDGTLKLVGGWVQHLSRLVWLSQAGTADLLAAYQPVAGNEAVVVLVTWDLVAGAFAYTVSAEFSYIGLTQSQVYAYMPDVPGYHHVALGAVYIRGADTDLGWPNLFPARPILEVPTHYDALRVENASGAAANPRDVGYLDDDRRYKTTTIAGDEQDYPCVVVWGGDDGEDIHVVLTGTVVVAYTGTAPVAGDPLTFSSVAGKVKVAGEGDLVVTVAKENGAGGFVVVVLAVQGGGGSIEVQEDDVFIADANVLNFKGGGGKVTDEGGGKVSIDIAGGGGAGFFSATKRELYVREVLYDETLAGDGTFDVSSIPQDYDHLELIMWLRSDAAATGDAACLRFNNDAVAANYYFGRHYGGSGHNVQLGDGPYVGFVPGNAAPADYYGVMQALVPQYAGDKYKAAHGISSYRDAAASAWVNHCVIHWENTDAINRVQVVPLAGTNFKAGSRLQVIGLRKLEVVTDISGSLATTLVASVAGVDMQTAGKTTLYTVPAGKVFVPVFVVVRSPSASMAGGTEYDFGSGANCDDWVQDVNLSGLTTPDTDSYIVAGLGAVYPVQTAGAEFGIKVITGTTAACTATLDVFGYLYDA
jgi:hypothetical protein